MKCDFFKCDLQGPSCANDALERKTDVRFNWLLSYIYPCYADLVQPLTQLIHKTVPFTWTDQCRESF